MDKAKNAVDKIIAENPNCYNSFKYSDNKEDIEIEADCLTHLPINPWITVSVVIHLADLAETLYSEHTFFVLELKQDWNENSEFASCLGWIETEIDDMANKIENDCMKAINNECKYLPELAEMLDGMIW